jgi:hypothetical protein
MKTMNKLTLAALLAFAAAGPVLAQAGPGGGVGTGDGTGAAAGTSEGGGGTTGWLANSPAFRGDARVTATGIAPADGSNTERSIALAGVPSTASMGAGPAVVAAPVNSSVHLIPGAVQVQAGTSESVNGNSRTVVTRYWANVPAGVERDADFQRWTRLK